MLTILHLHENSREVCIKTRSSAASLAVIGQVTKHTTVIWPIVRLMILLIWGLLACLSGEVRLTRVNRWHWQCLPMEIVPEGMTISFAAGLAIVILLQKNRLQ